MSMTVYRSSNQTVIAHHWSGAITPAERRHDLMPDRDDTPEIMDQVIAYNAECSIPLTLTVREIGDQFSVEGMPKACPLCTRRFSPRDQKRLHNAAVAGHLLAWDLSDESNTVPQDVILDI